jgi:hypothetical protein
MEGRLWGCKGEIFHRAERTARRLIRSPSDDQLLPQGQKDKATYTQCAIALTMLSTIFLTSHRSADRISVRVKSSPLNSSGTFSAFAAP